jgi:hypothetical protein
MCELSTATIDILRVCFLPWFSLLSVSFLRKALSLYFSGGANSMPEGNNDLCRPTLATGVTTE